VRYDPHMDPRKDRRNRIYSQINFGKRDKTEHEALNEVADELEKQAFLLRNLLNARKAGVKR
jgi:hypothetical protein